jgi:hypothetical protein
MATVRITKELTIDILTNAKAKFSADIRDAENNRPGHHWGDFIYDAIYGEYVSIMDQLPSGFIPTRDKLLVRRVGIHPVELYFEYSTPKVWPAILPPGSPAELYYNGAVMLDGSPVWDNLLKEVQDWKNGSEVVIKRRNDFALGVESVLESFSTLAPALKEWPALWELVPDYAKNKHKEITEKRSAVKANIDKEMLGRMTGAMTAAKLRGL